MRRWEVPSMSETHVTRGYQSKLRRTSPRPNSGARDQFGRNNIESTPYQEQARVLPLVCLLVLLALTLAWPGDVMAAEYLPIKPGNRWVLRSPVEEKPIELTVKSVKNERYILDYNNPFVPSVLHMRIQASKHLLETLEISGQRFDLPSGTVQFDLGASDGHKWSTPIADMRVISRSASVTTERETYRNCVEIEEVNRENGAAFKWTFCPDVGFARFGIGLFDFVLDESSSVIQTTVASAPSDTPPRASAERGDRLLSIAVTMDKKFDFRGAVAVAKTAGMHESGGLLNFDWNVIEPREGRFVDPDDGTLSFSNSFYPSQRMAATLTIAPIQTNVLAFPADLKGRSFDDPEVINRFNSMLDHVLGLVRDVQLRSIAIGNEVDAYLGDNAQRWREYTTFFKAAKKHLANRLPGVPVGAKVTYPALIGKTKALASALNAEADVIMTTYYPLNDDFKVRPPSVVTKDFGQLVKLYPRRPIYILEAGYPSSPDNGSSPKLQAEFVVEVFAAWDRYKDNIKLVDFTWLHDLAPATVNNMTRYYGLSSRGFKAYLSTLGLRTHDGRDKPAFSVLKREAKRRGW